MSLKSKLSKDKLLRYAFYKKEFLIVLYKSIINDALLDNDLKFFVYLKLASLLGRDRFVSHIRNRCVFTGRSRGITRFFKMSRILVRSKAAQGLLVGVKKSSW